MYLKVGGLAVLWASVHLDSKLHFCWIQDANLSNTHDRIIISVNVSQAVSGAVHVPFCAFFFSSPLSAPDLLRTAGDNAETQSDFSCTFRELLDELLFFCQQNFVSPAHHLWHLSAICTITLEWVLPDPVVVIIFFKLFCTGN